jgi:hypothetical protein
MNELKDLRVLPDVAGNMFKVKRVRSQISHFLQDIQREYLGIHAVGELLITELLA